MAIPMETVKIGVNDMLATLGDPSLKAKAKIEKIARPGEIISSSACL
jgi:hypothetical protein